MRWLYFDSSNPGEAAAHAAVVHKIDQWWNAFAAKTEDLDDLFASRSQWDLPDWMHQHLNAISPHLMWEYGPAVTGEGHRLVITPESERHLRPMVQTVLERAPKLAGWEFYAYRLPEDVEEASRMVEARTRGDLSGTLATAMIGEHHRINLCYHSPDTSGPDDQQAFENAFVATETLLGEEALDKWVGAITVESLRKPAGIGKLLRRNRRAGPGLLALDRLKPTVDALVAAIQDQLPDVPLYTLHSDDDSADSGNRWAVFELKPAQQDDYPHRDDLLVAVTGNVHVWRAFHEDNSFYSERFSRHGESFCYLKIDGSEGLDEDGGFSDRGSIEDAGNEVLIPARAGCVIGGGTGLRYSYIDLALTDVDAAIPLITRRLRPGKIARRTWLLFFDAPLAHEWIGMYGDTPAPPAAPGE
jgi:hypothetical protein